MSLELVDLDRLRRAFEAHRVASEYGLSDGLEAELLRTVSDEIANLLKPRANKWVVRSARLSVDSGPYASIAAPQEGFYSWYVWDEYGSDVIELGRGCSSADEACAKAEEVIARLTRG